jgi:hypothetical protein
MKIINNYFLKVNSLNIMLSCFINGLVAVIGSFVLVLSMLLAANFLDMNIFDGVTEYKFTLEDVVGLVVLAPILETFILGLIIKMLMRFGMKTELVCVVSAFLWGGIHALQAPIRFLGTIWSFFIFSKSFLYWNDKSYKKAFMAAAIPHVFVNSVVVLILAVLG